MTDHPMIFSGPMVRALIEGRKTQTRRILKPQPDYRGGAGDYHDAEEWGWEDEDGYHVSVLDIAPNGYEVGDRIWVREAWRTWADFDKRKAAFIPTDAAIQYPAENPLSPWDSRLRPSIHMPRWASRLTLVVTDVRVQRVQEITCADAIAEGMTPAANSQTIDCDTPDPREDFRSLWDSLNGAKTGCSWQENPWVCAVAFDVCRANIDEVSI